MFNVITKSGSNDWHGARSITVATASSTRNNLTQRVSRTTAASSSAALWGGPIRKDRAFFYAGFDQHFLTVPSIMQFGNGASSIVPQPTDYDFTDQALVMTAAQHLNTKGGMYPTTMDGDAGFGKLDFGLRAVA
ncbi:MAG: hypothetical protein P4M04_00890 [Acidobacteriota bacterium]|nr:hypothetical protein [Acidobacteriota bacterium]